MPSFEEVLDNATAWDGKTDKRITHGILAQAIDRNGTDLLKHASGTSNIAPSSPPITFDNTLLIASCTKLLTSICALQCVERGLIALDDPLDRHLPELAAQPLIALTPTNPPSIHPRPRTSPLTLRHLLTHASGSAHDKLHPALAAWRASHDGPAALRTSIAATCATPLVFEPGAGWAYGASTDWAGKLVERLHGGGAAALEAYMRANLFGPLGMADSTFLLATRPDVEERLVQTAESGKPDAAARRAREVGREVVEGREEGDEALGVAEEWMPREPEDCYGGSGLYTTVGDYLKVLRDLMQEEPKVLRRETVDAMFTPQLGEGSRRDLRTSMEVMGAMIGGMVPEGVRLDYGLGGLLVVDDNPETGMKGGTMTWAGHGNLVWFLNREANGGKGVGAMLATQLMPSGGEDISRLFREFIQEVWKRVD